MSRNIDDLDKLFAENDDVSSVLDRVDASVEEALLLVVHPVTETPQHGSMDPVFEQIFCDAPLTVGQHLARVGLSFCVTFSLIIAVWKYS